MFPGETYDTMFVPLGFYYDGKRREYYHAWAEVE